MGHLDEMSTNQGERRARESSSAERQWERQHELHPDDVPREEVVTSSNDVEHEVQRGDTLWKLARRYYGKGSRWREIYRANADIIDDPDMIRPGQMLRIPIPNEGLA